MREINFFKKNIFVIMSVILIFCVIDQIYMMIQYKNISAETIFVTLCLAGMNVFWGLLQTKKA